MLCSSLSRKGGFFNHHKSIWSTSNLQIKVLFANNQNVISRERRNITGKRLPSTLRSFSSKSSHLKSQGDADSNNKAQNDHWNENRVSAYIGHTFPDFIEHWNRDVFKKVGYGLTATTALVTGLTAASCDILLSTSNATLFLPAGILGIVTASYWQIGLSDIRQTQHAVRRNYPVLGNMRYILETVSRTRSWILSHSQILYMALASSMSTFHEVGNNNISTMS